MRFRSGGRDDLERTLRRAVAEPREEFVRSVARRVQAESRGGRLWTLSRLSFASSVAVLMLGTFASFGGLGYAATSAEQAADAVQEVLVPKKQKRVDIVTSSPAQRQYPIEAEEAEQPVETIEVAGRRESRQAQVPLAAAPERGELPFTGLALASTLALALGLLAVGLLLRRMARARAKVR
jgi:hypothetical protein